MRANPHDRLLATAATLIARQKSVVSRCRAMGWNAALAESLLAELEKSEQLARSRSAEASLARRALGSSFLSSVAHDFKNHLQSLKLDLYSAQHSNTRDSAADVSRFGDIEGGLSMMNLLSQDLLIASKMQGSKLGLRVRPHSVARLLKEVSNVSAPIARLSGVRLQVARVPEGLRIRCDRDQMLHAMASLVVRVARATRQGGSVTLSAEPRSDTVRFVLAPDAARVVKRAPGVSKTHGSALHAWLATTLIESQGGRVWSGKAVGRDSHIYFTMPSAKRTAGRSSEP